MIQVKQSIVFLLCCLVLSACVTTTDSALTRKADPEAAAKKYVHLGLEYIKRDDYVRARKHLLRSLEIDPENASASAALGLIYHRDGELEIAEEYFTTALESDPAYTRGRTYYAAFLFSEKRYKQSLEQFELAAKDTEYVGRAQIFTNIALCNIKLGNEQKALAAYEKTLRLDRLNGRALSGITQLLIQTGNYQRAQYFYNQLVKLIRQEGMKHSAQSLWMGIQISRYYGSTDQEQSLAALLYELYPNSREYAEYKKLEQGS